MADGVQEGGQITESLAGTKTFEGSPIGERDPMLPTEKPAPEGVPAKFWDANKGALNTEALLKSYSELEKKLGGGGQEEAKEGVAEAAEVPEGSAKEPKEESSEEAKEETSEGSEEETPEETSATDLSSAMEAAQAVYGETGTLDEAAREPFLKAGISNEQIDLYLQGVKAQEAGLKQAAMKAAGVDDYTKIEEAIKWASENWSVKKVNGFNSLANDVETIPQAITALFQDYRSANPGEGHLVNANSGANRGDVYTHRDQFQADLKAADDARDGNARRVAVAKMQRSLKARSIK